ncbi:ATP synthase F0 subunit B [Mariprofundus sp. KV]|uniref:F0F1 ATP synthase subunit B family protein n=1 Tax=Mariprofundus sp. KV TaxID=2608715 RepID=UPI0015A3C119|nr:ATP synthase F0 subunit B [Mariprofundus sp. KV]NWF35988.1 ATP synthase F0 subunit B [Mariprofundus sp. KV]
MPQFDTTFFSSQIFWTIISFVVLYVVLGKWILPRIANTLNQRTQLIKDEIDAARHQREEVEEIKLDYAEKLAHIDDEAKKLFEESERRIIERRGKLMDEWKVEMERKTRDFHEEAEAARLKAISDIRAQSADLIVDAAEKVIHQRIDKREAQIALEEAIEALEKKPEKRG